MYVYTYVYCRCDICYIYTHIYIIVSQCVGGLKGFAMIYCSYKLYHGGWLLALHLHNMCFLGKAAAATTTKDKQKPKGKLLKS